MSTPLGDLGPDRCLDHLYGGQDGMFEEQNRDGSQLPNGAQLAQRLFLISKDCRWQDSCRFYVRGLHILQVLKQR